MDLNTKFPEEKLPESRKKYLKIFYLIVLSLVCIFGIFMSYKYLFGKREFLSSTNNQMATIFNTTDSDPLEIFYYTKNESSEEEVVKKENIYKIFKVSSSLDKQDVSIHTVTFKEKYAQIITDTWKKNVILFTTKNEKEDSIYIYSLDISLKNSQPQIIYTVSFDDNKDKADDEKRHIGDIKYIDGGNSLAFITSQGLMDSSNSVLNIVSLKNQQIIETHLVSKESPRYGHVSFLERTSDGRIIYFSDNGEDYGSWYKVNRDTKEVQNLDGIPQDIPRQTSRYIFSPDRTKIAYAGFSAFTKEGYLDSVNNEEGAEDYADGPCLKFFGSDAMKKYEPEGGVIMVQDLKTKNTKEVFRNLSYSDNLCKNIARRIIALRWLDNSNIVFETVAGVFSLDLKTKQKQTLFTFRGTIDPKQQRPSITYIKLPYIILDDNSILNVNTNKHLNFIVPTNGLQEVEFFTFE